MDFDQQIIFGSITDVTRLDAFIEFTVAGLVNDQSFKGIIVSHNYSPL